MARSLQALTDLTFSIVEALHMNVEWMREAPRESVMGCVAQQLRDAGYGSEVEASAWGDLSAEHIDPVDYLFEMSPEEFEDSPHFNDFDILINGLTVDSSEADVHRAVRALIRARPGPFPLERAINDLRKNLKMSAKGVNALLIEVEHQIMSRRDPDTPKANARSVELNRQYNERMAQRDAEALARFRAERAPEHTDS
jgi:hypothetical protein